MSGGAAEAVRRALGTWVRRWVFVGTLLLGSLVAASVTATFAPADRTFAAVSDPAQSLMSVLVPMLGILLAHDLRRSPDTVRLAPTALAAVCLAAVVGIFGATTCAAAIATAGTDPAQDPWQHAGTILLGSVLVQIVAVLVGIGLGLLLRSAAMAFLASIVLPLGLYLVLAVDVARPAQAWLAPYASVRNLLAGDMTPQAWAQWLVVLLLWGVGLNAVGIARLRRR